MPLKKPLALFVYRRENQFMSDDIEAIGTMVEGGLVAKAVDDEGKLVRAEGEVAGECLNCGAPVVGKYCGHCGQPLHVHRSIGALWHDILHGVLHFEGKFWRTLPLLAWKPGDLTRRYIHGERAQFISPMALFLFSIFMMFAVFSFMGSPFSTSDGLSTSLDGGFSSGVATESERLEKQIVEKTEALKTATPDEREVLEREITDMKRGRNVMATMTMSELPYPEVGLDEVSEATGGAIQIEDSGEIISVDGDFEPAEFLEKSAFGRKLKQGIESANANPNLLIYKLQANGYKFAWLLIPISVPFVWLTMIGRRGFRFYDHAIFATYSIAFMSLLFIFCAVLAATGIADWLWPLLLVVYPPIHMYRQLRHAYSLSRPEAIVRVIFLFFFTIISLTIFFLILLALGVLG